MDASLNLFQSDPDCLQICLMYALEDREYMQERYQGQAKVELHVGGKPVRKVRESGYEVCNLRLCYDP